MSRRDIQDLRRSLHEYMSYYLTAARPDAESARARRQIPRAGCERGGRSSVRGARARAWRYAGAGLSGWAFAPAVDADGPQVGAIPKVAAYTPNEARLARDGLVSGYL